MSWFVFSKRNLCISKSEWFTCFHPKDFWGHPSPQLQSEKLRLEIKGLLSTSLLLGEPPEASNLSNYFGLHLAMLTSNLNSFLTLPLTFTSQRPSTDPFLTDYSPLQSETLYWRNRILFRPTSLIISCGPITSFKAPGIILKLSLLSCYEVL